MWEEKVGEEWRPEEELRTVWSVVGDKRQQEGFPIHLGFNVASSDGWWRGEGGGGRRVTRGRARKNQEG